MANHICRGVKKNGKRCSYLCQDNFMCKIHACQAVSQDCAICHEVIKAPFEKTTPCGHMFHTKCYQNWHDTPHGNTCPLCRSPLKKLPIETMNSIIDDFKEAHSMFIDDFAPAHKTYIQAKNETAKKINDLIIHIHSTFDSEEPSTTQKEILKMIRNNLSDIFERIMTCK